MKPTQIQRVFVETALHDGLSIAEIVEAGIDEGYVLERARFHHRPLIFESAPSTKGSTMTSRAIRDLKPNEVRRIAELYSKHGLGNETVGRVSRTFSITESDAQAFADALGRKKQKSSITESEGIRETAKTITEALRTPVLESLATTVHRANAAEERGLEHASLQELTAVAALGDYFPSR